MIFHQFSRQYIGRFLIIYYELNKKNAIMYIREVPKKESNAGIKEMLMLRVISDANYID